MMYTIIFRYSIYIRSELKTIKTTFKYFLKFMGLKKFMQRFIFFLILAAMSSPVFSQMTSQLSYSLNGTTAYYSVPDAAELNPGTNATFEFWVKLNSLPSPASVLIGKNYFTGYAIGVQSTGAVFLQKGAAGGFVNSTTLLTVNNWTHVAITYSNGTVNYFFNGIAAGNGSTTSGPLPSVTDSLFIGCDRESGIPAYFQACELDNIRIWNVVRTISQIQQLRFAPFQFTPGNTGQYAGLVFSAHNDFFSADYSGGSFSILYPRGGAATVNYSQKPVFYNDYNSNLYFDGTSWISAPNFSDFNPTTAITVEFWMKRDTTGSQNPVQHLVNKSGSTNRYNWGMYLGNGGTQVDFALNSGLAICSSPVIATPLGRWYHLAGTWSQATGLMKLYINGDSVASFSYSGPINNDPDSLCVGGIGAANFIADRFKGQIDDIRIWSTAKTTAEIKRDMYINNNPAVGTPPYNNIEYSFDATTFIPRLASGNSYLFLPIYFRGNGVTLVSSHANNNALSTAPLLRDDVGGFPNYVISTKRAFIPDLGSYSDSVLVTASGQIANLRVFVLLNHTYVSDITLTLRGPQGQSVILYTQPGVNTSNDIITVFDGAADSSVSLFAGQAPYSPRIKPSNSLTVFNGTQSAGYWKLTIADGAGSDIGYINGWGVQTNIVTGTGNETQVPYKFYLDQNYPNPFNPVTSINFGLAKDEDVNIVVYDILGREIKTLVNEYKMAGNYKVEFNAASYASGIYFYKIKAGDFVDIKKMVLVK